MTTPQQQFSRLSQANLEKTLKLTQFGIATAERLFNMQLGIARNILLDNIATTKAYAHINDVQDLIEFQQSLSQSAVAKIMSVARTVYETAGETQSELNKLVEEQLIDFNKNLQISLDSAVAEMPASSSAVSVIKNAVESAIDAYSTVAKGTQRTTSKLVATTASAVESSTKKASRSPTRKTA